MNLGDCLSVDRGAVPTSLSFKTRGNMKKQDTIEAYETAVKDLQQAKEKMLVAHGWTRKDGAGYEGGCWEHPDIQDRGFLPEEAMSIHYHFLKHPKYREEESDDS